MKMFALLPVAMLVFVSGLTLSWTHAAQNAVPASIDIQATQSGQMFVAYRNAVQAYQQANPTNLASVSPAQLSAQGNNFPQAFLAISGNTITGAGSPSGRIIYCYATFSGPIDGAITAALAASNNDPSLGIAWGTIWMSQAQSAKAVISSLPMPLPSDTIVSVIQIGV